ncbi:MAG: hypothetical protein RL069_849, partial [Planctomycetota bacterium]
MLSFLPSALPSDRFTLCFGAVREFPIML